MDCFGLTFANDSIEQQMMEGLDQDHQPSIFDEAFNPLEFNPLASFEDFGEKDLIGSSSQKENMIPCMDLGAADHILELQSSLSPEFEMNIKDESNGQGKERFSRIMTSLHLTGTLKCKQ